MTKPTRDIFPPAFYKPRPRNPNAKSLRDLRLCQLMDMFGGEDHLFAEALQAWGSEDAAKEAWEAHYSLPLAEGDHVGFRLGLIAMHLEAKIDAIEAAGAPTSLN